jgi:hypothetical protein
VVYHRRCHEIRAGNDRARRLSRAENARVEQGSARPIPVRVVFALYERNWRFIDTSRLTGEEAQLIRDLTALYGNGVLLVS